MSFTRVRLVPIALLACVLVAYFPVLDYGLWFDDYMDLRPYSFDQLRAMLAGHWGVPGWQDDYHRPLTALHNALRFEIFGLNTRALHALSLAGLVAITWTMFGWIKHDAGWAVAAGVTVVYVWHPVLPDSTVAWVSNQKHIYAVWLVVGAMALWTRRRSSVGWRQWWPIALCAVLGFLVKEDTVMVLPALVVLQAVRARVWGDVPAPSRALIIGIAGILVALAVIRLTVFPFAEAVTLTLNEARSWPQQLLLAGYPVGRTLLAVRSHGELMLLATACITVLLGTGGWAACRRPRTVGAWLWTQGAVLTAGCALPLLFAPDLTTMRAHLLVVSGSLMWAGGAVSLIHAARGRGARHLATGAVAVLAVLLMHVTWTEVRERYRPCGWQLRYFDTDVSAWPEEIITADTKTWLERKRHACDAGQVPTLWGEMASMGWRTENGAVAMVAERVTAVRLTVRASGIAQTVIVQRDGREVGRGTGASDLVLDVPLTPTMWSRLRAAHRLDVIAGGPVTMTLVPR